MYNDNDRLQQMEDNWNAGDGIYESLGLQADIIRRIAKDNEKREEAIEYFEDEGFPRQLAEEYADAQLNNMNKEEK